MQTHDLQIRLNALGYGPLLVDGVAGPKTLQSVRQFQAAQGLDVDGVAGPNTWAALKANRAPQQPTSALDYALADLGKAESPLGSNAGPQIGHLVDGYGSHWGISGSARYPWCAMAVGVWTARGLGLGSRGDSIDWERHPFGHWFGGVAQIEDWAGERLRTDWGNCPPGAIYTMAREGSSSDPSKATRAGHTGLVIAIEGSRAHCVDGNVSNAVSRRTRRIRDLRGWILI